jgi:hypothetical protein
MTAYRWALYWTPPPEHALAQAGSRWLGRDATQAGPPWPEPARPGVATPWRYGFHATLKPPMRLREGHSAQALLEAAEAVAAATPSFAMPALAVGWHDDFLALKPVAPVAPSHPLRALADALVQQLDPWRDTPTPAELAKRQRSRLDGEQQALLDRWGYPHVLARWRFHLTLSEGCQAMSDAAREAFADTARAHFSTALTAPLRCTDVAVFVEPQAGAPLQLLRRLPLRDPA